MRSLSTGETKGLGENERLKVRPGVLSQPLQTLLAFPTRSVAFLAG